MSAFTVSQIGKGERTGATIIVVNSGGGVNELLHEYARQGLQESPELVSDRESAWEEGIKLWERLATEGGILGSNGIIYAIGSNLFGDKQQEVNDQGVVAVKAKALSAYNQDLETIMGTPAGAPNSIQNIYGRQISEVTNIEFNRNTGNQGLFLIGAGIAPRLGFETLPANRQRPEIIATRKIDPPKFVLFPPDSRQDENPSYLHGSLQRAIGNHVAHMYRAHNVSAGSLISPDTFTYAMLFSMHPRRSKFTQRRI